MLNTVSNPQFFRFNRMKPSDTEFSGAKGVTGLPQPFSISADLHKKLLPTSTMHVHCGQAHAVHIQTAMTFFVSCRTDTAQQC